MANVPIAPRTRLTDYQVLTEYMNGKLTKEQLTPHLQIKLQRATKIYEMLLDAQGNNHIVETLMDDFQISQAQAWRDLHMAEALFGNIRQANKSMKRQIAENMALETYRMAKEENDTKGMAAANRNYIAATGIENEDIDLPEFDKLQPSVYAVVLDEQTRNMFNHFIQKSGGSLDLTKFIETVEDATIDDTDSDGANK